MVVVTEDVWADLTDRFVEGAYATVKGRVRTYVLHRHLMDHLPPPPAAVLDVGGGAGHQSLPLARLGYEIVLLDSSEAMLATAEQRLAAESADVRDRVRLVLGSGEDAPSLTQGRRFAAVLCHGVLMYLPEPTPMIEALCACTAVDGIVSVMALNAATLAVRPALEHRWDDAQAAFHARGERGVLGLDTRADTVEELSGMFADHGVRPLAWYGVWLFTDWMTLDDEDELTRIAEVELEASRRDPYRHLSRVFHLVGRR
ncbi:methyltransferase domain-containing protein [Protofrankia symbiont of Coriaria ruscifolia]|uniref:methyltransferase domain-containing protein n=1 Tax=Protofrankia symbiont of Coriaria ruscifolia TaxID=1306542 RepID=UPI001F5EF8F4|nr:methyltransferase domain-containing protein [Protofrankia symbiont of Coriaria ruscifolia]